MSEMQRFIDQIIGKTSAADRLPCPICRGMGWLHFSCGTPRRCRCNPIGNSTHTETDKFPTHATVAKTER
jgi:hypothetical protein